MPELTDRQCEVINALAFSNMHITNAARMVGLSYKRIDEHIKSIKEKTGKDPRDFFDLQDLFEMAGR